VTFNGRPTATFPFWEPARVGDHQNVSINHPTQLSSRHENGLRISHREWTFAFWYVLGEFGPGTGLLGFKRSAWVAYMKAFPACESKAAARASASRLMKRPRVKAAIAWEFAKLDRLPEIRCFHPWTAIESLGHSSPAGE